MGKMTSLLVLLVPALLAKYWIKQPLDYSWFRGRWSLKMWLWLPLGFVLAFGFMWLYFNVLTPTLHHSWPLPLTGDRTDAMWRLFWGCNFVGVWDELAFINLVFVLLSRHFRFGEANLAQAVFFTSFLHEMAFVGWGPVVIYLFALTQGLTYRKTGSWGAAVGEMFEEPARAISRNVIVIAIGFTPLLAATLIPYKTVGLFLASIMALSGLATMFILPSLLTVLEPWLFKKIKN